MAPATNPLLDEINGLSPGAKAALMQAHASVPAQMAQPANPVLAAARQASPTAPAPLLMPSPSQLSSVPAMGSQPPAVSGPRGQKVNFMPQGTTGGDEQERQRLMATGSGVDQIKQPFLHGLAKTGDVLGNVLLPGLAARIPGTTAHHNVLIAQNEKQLGTDIGNQQKEAQTAEIQARVPLEQAQTNELEERLREMPGEAEQKSQLTDAQIVALLHPQAKTDFEAWRQQNPNAPITDWLKAQAEAKPKNIQAKTLQLPNGEQIPGKVDSQGNLLLADGTPAPQGTKLYQQPNYGQMVLPTKTATFIGEDGIPREYQWNEATQTYDKPLGLSASNAYGHEAAQAGAVDRAASGLIQDIEAHKDKLGNPKAIIESAILNTPWADPETAQLRAEIATFAALQPSMHGFRGQQAMQQFEKILGGIPNNPEALVASINGIRKTAGAINPGLGQGSTPTGFRVRLSDAMALPQNKGKSEADVRKDVKAHGGTVVQ